ncbi:hypothetical protein [Acinetobacter pittii]|uniref:hypothetical protein n=1 Tax=Acinetobacter pittii TaxID=48296 RepID=UPI0026DF67CA|nr:hypothetical protein [Acinetobacter pittii]
MNNESIELHFYLSESTQRFAIVPLTTIDDTFEEVDEQTYGLMQAALAQGKTIYKDNSGIWRIKEV